MYSSLEIIYIYIYLILTFKERLMKGQHFFGQKIAILVGPQEISQILDLEIVQFQFV